MPGWMWGRAELWGGLPGGRVLHAIEGWWKVLRDRLDLTAPEEIESRLEFVTRLRRTVAWLNINDREHAVALARNQKVRARAILHQEGARTKW